MRVSSIRGSPVRTASIRSSSVRSLSNGRTSRRDKLSSELYDQPGHLIRRAQQIAVSMFFSTIGSDVTPVQYAVLRVVQDNPGIDQVTLARLCALDTSTAANLAVRLAQRGMLKRMVPTKSKRFRLLHLTPRGAGLVKKLIRSERVLSRRLLEALGQEEQKVFLGLLKKFVHLNNEESRAPLDRGVIEAKDQKSNASVHRVRQKPGRRPSYLSLR